MEKEEIYIAALAVTESTDPYSAEYYGEKLLGIIKKNMDETASLIDQDYFPSNLILAIAEKAREATAYTGISSLSKALSRWCLRHNEEEIKEIKAYSEETEKEAESVPF